MPCKQVQQTSTGGGVQSSSPPSGILNSGIHNSGIHERDVWAAAAAACNNYHLNANSSIQQHCGQYVKSASPAAGGGGSGGGGGGGGGGGKAG